MIIVIIQKKKSNESLNALNMMSEKFEKNTNREWLVYERQTCLRCLYRQPVIILVNDNEKKSNNKRK